MIKLHNADCLQVLRKEIEPNSIDMVLTDPPYGTTAAQWDAIVPLKPMWSGIERVINDKSAMVLLFGKNPFTAKLISSNYQRFSYDLVWEKSRAPGGLSANQKPFCKIEYISVFRYGKYKYEAQCTMRNENVKKGERDRKARIVASNQHRVQRAQHLGKNLSPTKKFPMDLLRFPSPMNRLHPTQKPVKLLMYLIESYTLPGETVLDFCMGSGSTAIAAMATGRNFIGIELEKNIYEKASRRIDLYRKKLISLGKMEAKNE